VDTGSSSLAVPARRAEATFAPASATGCAAGPRGFPARATGPGGAAWDRSAIGRLLRAERILVVARPTVPSRRQERGWLGDRSARGDRLHPLDLLGGERSQLSRLKARDRDARLRRPEQTHHRVPHRGGQALHQVRPSLPDLEEEPGVSLGSLEALGAQRPRRSVLEAHSLQQPGQRLVGGRTLHLREIGPGHLEARVQEPVRRIAVIGEQQRALGVPVEATHGEHPLLHSLQQPGHGRSALGVGQRRHHPGRLVEQVPRGALRHRHQLPVDHHQIGGFHLGPELGHALVVDAHPSGGDEPFCVPAGRHPGAGEELL